LGVVFGEVVLQHTEGGGPHLSVQLLRRS
jgi:hypothetical protein